jgi:hypothetical protein
MVWQRAIKAPSWSKQQKNFTEPIQTSSTIYGELLPHGQCRNYLNLLLRTPQMFVLAGNWPIFTNLSLCS